MKKAKKTRALPPSPPKVLCAAGKHEVGHPSLPCDACADEATIAVHRPVCLEAEDITQVQDALRSVRQFLQLVKAPLVGAEVQPDLPVEQVIREAVKAEQVLQQALLASLKQPQS